MVYGRLSFLTACLKWRYVVQGVVAVFFFYLAFCVWLIIISFLTEKKDFEIRLYYTVYQNELVGVNFTFIIE